MQIPLWILVLDRLPKWLEIKNAQYELDQDEFYYGIDFEAKSDLLDTIINEEVNRYYILKLGYKKPEEIWLKDEDQRKLIKDIAARVYAKRMTPAVIANISFYYRFNDDKELLELIMDKTSFAVINLAMKTNNTNIQL